MRMLLDLLLKNKISLYIYILGKFSNSSKPNDQEKRKKFQRRANAMSSM